jgi:peptide deformylase
MVFDARSDSMAVRKLVRLGNPALRTPSEPVPEDRIGAAEVQQVIADLIDTLRTSGGSGLAAPEIGVNWQIFIFESEQRGEPRPVRTVINPLLEPHAGELVYDWEGCLSIPDLVGLVPRHPSVRLWGRDGDGQPLDLELSGFAGRVAQHEYDHLHGIVFLDRMRDLRSLSFMAEWESLVAGEERAALG